MTIDNAKAPTMNADRQFGAQLRLIAPADDGQQLAGHEGLTDEGCFVAGWLSAIVAVEPLAAWVAVFREHAQEHPREAAAIVESFGRFVHGTTNPGEMADREKREAVLHEHIAEASDDELRVIGVLLGWLDKARHSR